MVKYFIIRRPFIMAREKKPVHKVQMTEGKRLIFRYDRKNPRLLFSSRSTLTVHI